MVVLGAVTELTESVSEDELVGGFCRNTPSITQRNQLTVFPHSKIILI
jgi:hypothetical protein